MTARAPDLGLAAFDPDTEEVNGRQIRLTPASDIKIRPVIWVWEGRLALGTLGLLAGPEGVGKSTLGYWLAARITRGELPGEYHGRAAAVLVAATEDSWEHTIVPRLMAARADLSAVYRVDVVNEDALTCSLSLPKDLSNVEDAAEQVGAALMLLDPLMSRLDAKIDSHKDADVRLALEPLVAIADTARMSILGLIHHNKSGSTDPLQLVMASKAFTAVARSVHTVIRDPDDETGERRLFGTPKNNLGRIDLPMLAYNITGHHVGDTDEGPVWTGRLNWLGEVAGTIRETMSRSVATDDERSAVAEAADWLTDYLSMNGGTVDSADAKKDGAKAGHSQETLKRARRRLGVGVTNIGFPRRTNWTTDVDPTVTTDSDAYVPVGDQSGQPLGRLREVLTNDSRTTRTGDVPLSTSTPDIDSQTVGSTPTHPPRARPDWGTEPPPDEDELLICPGCDLPIDPSIKGGLHPACDPWEAT